MVTNLLLKVLLIHSRDSNFDVFPPNNSTKYSAHDIKSVASAPSPISIKDFLGFVFKRPISKSICRDFALRVPLVLLVVRISSIDDFDLECIVDPKHQNERLNMLTIYREFKKFWLSLETKLFHSTMQYTVARL